MFAKPFKVKSHSHLKTSERKKLKSEIGDSFPTLAEEELEQLVPSKEEVVLTKVYTHKGQIVGIYQIQKQPLFFRVDKEKEICPTVYMLWQYPHTAYAFTVDPYVVDVLKRGADLMVPGINIQGQVNSASYGFLNKGSVVGINTSTSCAAIAVGITALASSDMAASRRGKGVIVYHTHEDYLWAMGSRSNPPELGRPFQPSEGKSKTGNPDAESPASPEPLILDMVEKLHFEDSSQSESVTEEPDDLPKSPFADKDTNMDTLLHYCLLKALKTSAKKIELPLLTSALYGIHMSGACPQGLSLDVKKSSYKKFSKFMNEMAVQGLLEVQEFPKGVENIIALNYAHEALKAFTIDENDAVPDVPVIEGFIPPEIEMLYQVSGTTIEFFRANKLSKGDVLSKEQVRAIVTQYIKSRNLQKDNKVELDSLIHNAIVGSKEGFKEYMKWDEIFSRFLGRMSPAYKIKQHGKAHQIIKGSLPSIKIAVARRTGNKKVTLIHDAAKYGIDEEVLAHQIQIGAATSTSIGEAKHCRQGTTQVLVQGNKVKFIEKLLLETYKIPKKYVIILECGEKEK